MNPDNLTDSEARQPRLLEGEAVLRTAAQGLLIPARAYKDGIIYQVKAQVAGRNPFENQAANLLELNTAAALRLRDAIEDFDGEAEDFEFSVELADLTRRRKAWVHPGRAEARDNQWLDDKEYAQPIIGLDVDADGDPLDVNTLRKAVAQAESAAAAAAPAGFSAATGGAFES